MGVQADEWPLDTPSGEWRPLKYSNYLLSERFGRRKRPYMVHVAKSISPSILREVATIWSSEFAETSSHRFRGERDVYTTFLHGHYIVERWRELLLWSWIVGRIGNDDDSLGEEERTRLWIETGGSENLNEFLVLLKMRSTLEKQRVKEALEDAGEQQPAATEYIFCAFSCFRQRIGSSDWFLQRAWMGIRTLSPITRSTSGQRSPKALMRIGTVSPRIGVRISGHSVNSYDRHVSPKAFRRRRCSCT